MVIYEDEKFLRKVLGKKKNGETQTCCLEKPYDITELKDFEELEDAILSIEVFNQEVVPKMLLGGAPTSICHFFGWDTPLYMLLFLSVGLSICLSLVHHISGTIHHVITIFGTHL